MHIHILGICGTFMGGVALIAKEKGFRVTGSDANVYPPMSTQLREQGIELIEGYEAAQLTANPDCVVIGNALTRGKPVIEALLNQQRYFVSGPEWIAKNILKDKWVLAVAGTHGKTTTTSMLAWILECAGLKPGFLIGGVPQNFGVSARLGDGKYFVIEADEYDSAFFDKRSKFIHYHPRTLILNNLEFDHADIFPDIAAIKTQFHYLVRTVPSEGLIVRNQDESNISDVLQRGIWTPVTTFAEKNADWQIGECNQESSEFSIYYHGKREGSVKWSLLGKHNRYNALAAVAAAHHVGVSIDVAARALAEFKNVKRRLEIRGEKRGIIVYDDFAHHPTAIATTLAGLRAKFGNAKIIAVLECASNTMRMGVYKNDLAPALKDADEIIFLRPTNDWGIDAVASQLSQDHKICARVEDIMDYLVIHGKPGNHIVLMSNGGFGGLPEKLLKVL